MRKSRFSDHQILGILKQAEAGTSVPDLCREHGISSATFYKWRGTVNNVSMQHDGYGPTIMKGQTWPWVASPRNKSWPSWPRLYFWAEPKKGGLPSQFPIPASP